MSAPRSPWTDRLLEVLADGEWHTYDELAAAAGPLVPPGYAQRTNESNRTRMSSRRNGDPRARHGAFDHADPITAGQRRVVIHALWKLSQRQPIVLAGPNYARRARLAPKAAKR